MTRINVTKSFMPPLEDYQRYVQRIWESGQLTNQGPLLKEFEQKTAEYLDVNNFHFVTNGTIALQIALRALNIFEGEIITTPFSYVATTSAILWERYTPVYVDIEPETFCIDTEKIEAAITDDTKAIMAVHVFGYPCDVEKIEAIAQKYNLKVIYDGAHAFGAVYKGKSLLHYGDISTCSFHATKLFHTIEGGCIVAKDEEVSQRVELLKRFGHNGDKHYMLGINAKATEFQAAMGLCNLNHIDSNIRLRKVASELYDKLLNDNLTRKNKNSYKQNYMYYPVVFESEKKVEETINKLNAADIFPRRYFYPALNTLPYLDKKQSCPIAENIARRIVCLPLYPGLEAEDIKRICSIVNAS